ncbi:MAG TPA: hypothetical protein DCL41_02065 [Bdellovibrionales bacterium]|nr:hypothetical protein [Pseudobdellovibrionaceae bacterium]HAG90625.1 hypothetical protein [Bdellovibrionales bacterium]
MKSQFGRSFLIFIFLLGGAKASARVFSFETENFAAVLEGTFGTTHLAQDGFAANKGGGVSLSENYNYTGSAKLGFALAPGDKMNFVFGLEVLRPLSISAAKGNNASGTQLYTFDSTLIALNPMFAVEYAYSRSGNVRYLFGVGLGYGQVTTTNEFNMTETGVSELGVSSYKETLKGSAINGYTSLGLEAHFVDKATFTFQAGYRLFKVHELKHGSSLTNVGEGAVSDGDIAYNADGSKRKVDLTGMFLSMGFRIYIP